MAAITPEDALAYFRRWELVRDAEARELRRTPMETKLQQLASLMASRHVFGPEPDREAETRVVRERWARSHGRRTAVCEAKPRTAHTAYDFRDRRRHHIRRTAVRACGCCQLRKSRHRRCASTTTACSRFAGDESNRAPPQGCSGSSGTACRSS